MVRGTPLMVPTDTTVLPSMIKNAQYARKLHQKNTRKQINEQISK